MRLRRDRTLQIVVAITALAFLVRLVWLGSRVAHWDEARVMYWILEYGATGVLFYRPIIHGPLLHLVNTPIVAVLGASDATMRLFPAVVGGLFPLVALAFRHRLRDETVVALAALLAVDPILLYYSRFMRNDILVAVFMVAAFACLLRAIDFDDGRFVILAGLFAALGFGAKENALAYLIAWLGATVLLFEHRLFLARTGDRSPVQLIGDYGWWTARGIGRHVRAVLGSIAVFLLAVTVIYAPRGALPSQGFYYRSCRGYDGYFDVAAAPTLGEALVNPLRLPRLVVFTLGSTAELYVCQWIGPRTDELNPYLEFLGELVGILLAVSGILVLLAVIGFIVDRYRGDRPDDLISFAFYWGVASLIGYPVIADIGGAAWLLVHVVVPLTIPAAVALGTIGRWGIEAYHDQDTIALVLAVVLILVLVGPMASIGYDTNVANPQSPDNPLVQYAQPGGDLKPTLAQMQELADDNDGVDVVLYGEHFHNPVEGEEIERRPVCSNWFNALPLPWYFEAGDMTADCAPDEDSLDAALADDPPVIIVHENERAAVDERVGDQYTAEVHLLRSFDTPVVFYLDESRIE